MKTILVIFYSPFDVFGDFESYGTNEECGIADEDIKEHCFRKRRYATEGAALMAYAETPCCWSTLKDEDDDIEAFIDEAYEHIRTYDYDWLEQNFV